MALAGGRYRLQYHCKALRRLRSQCGYRCIRLDDTPRVGTFWTKPKGWESILILR